MKPDLEVITLDSFCIGFHFWLISLTVAKLNLLHVQNEYDMEINLLGFFNFCELVFGVGRSTILYSIGFDF